MPQIIELMSTGARNWKQMCLTSNLCPNPLILLESLIQEFMLKWYQEKCVVSNKECIWFPFSDIENYSIDFVPFFASTQKLRPNLNLNHTNYSDPHGWNFLQIFLALSWFSISVSIFLIISSMWLSFVVRHLQFCVTKKQSIQHVCKENKMNLFLLVWKKIFLNFFIYHSFAFQIFFLPPHP